MAGLDQGQEYPPLQMDPENKTSDEILNELYDSLNLPASPILTKKRVIIKTNNCSDSSCDTDESSSDDDDDSHSENALSSAVLKTPDESSNKYYKKKDKKKRKKIKKEGKSKHKKKKKKKDSDNDITEIKSFYKTSLPSSDLKERADDNSSKASVNCVNLHNFKETDDNKERSRTSSPSKNRDHYSKSKSKSKTRYSRSRSKSRTRSHKKYSKTYYHQSHSRSRSHSPSKNGKYQSKHNKSPHTRSPSPRKSYKTGKSKSDMPVKKETKDPLDTWRMAKLASLKSKSSLATKLEFESFCEQTSKTSNSDIKLEACVTSLNSDSESILPTLEAIPLPVPIPKNSPEKFDQSIKNDIDIACIPVPTLDEQSFTIKLNNGSEEPKESLRIVEAISRTSDKVKDEGKCKTIVIKSLMDSLILQQAEKAQIKKDEDIYDDIKTDDPVATSVDLTQKDPSIKKHNDAESVFNGTEVKLTLVDAEENIKPQLDAEINIKPQEDAIIEDGEKEKITRNKKVSKEKRSSNEKKSKRRSQSRSRTHRKSQSRSRIKRSSSRSRKRNKRSISGRRKRSRSHSKSRSNSKTRKSSHGKSKRSRSRSRTRRKSSRSRTRSHSHGKSSHRKRSSYSREHSNRKKSPDCVDSLRDKATRKRLLEVARRNAVYLMKNNCLPPSIEKESVKATGKSVEELTSFCKQLVAKEEFSDQELSDPSLSPDEETEFLPDKPFGTSRHPFAIKDSKPILMNIRNAPMLPTKTNAERLADTSKLREQFPVSSGSQHRNKEGWVTVEKDEKIKEETVFPEATKTEVDISSLVSTRLSAMRRLQDNPQDRDAIKALSSAQKDMQDWALSKQAPGQFTGSTGARILSQEELSSGFQAWARKEQFKEATPVSSHFGMKMLQKMGWNPGEGLGKNKEGQIEPLLLDVKTDKKGLTAQQEMAPRRVNLPLARSLAGKHPVSALTEICNKRKWGPPEFDLLYDGGPDHKKNFFMKVIVNGQTYQSGIAAHTKKIAKANAAAAVLQALGLIPKDPAPKPDATLNTTSQIVSAVQITPPIQVVNTESPTVPALPQPAGIQAREQSNQAQKFPPPPLNPVSSLQQNAFLGHPQIPSALPPVCYPPHQMGFYGSGGAPNSAMFGMQRPNASSHVQSRLQFIAKSFHP